MRRILRWSLVALALTPLALFATHAPAARAADDWCDIDPLELISTPGGHLVPVYDLIGAQGVTASVLNELSDVSYTVAPANGGAATLVTMKVTVNAAPLVTPAGTPTRVSVTTGLWGTGSVYAATTGAAGSPMTVQFTVPVS